MSFRLPTVLSQHQRGSNSNENETHNLDQHITGGVDAREAVPVPVRNVCCYRGQNSGDQNETDAAGKAANTRLCQSPNRQNCLEHFGAEFDGQRFAECELTAGRMIHENAGRVRRYSLLHLFHRLVLLLARRVLASAETGKDIEAGVVTDTALHRAKYSRFVRYFSNPSFAQRQSHVSD